MSNDLLINVTGDETRIAFLEQGVLSEIFIERQHEVGIVGNIYKGKVQRVLPGMEAAFVELGEDKAGFLYVTDFSQEVVKDVEEDEEDNKEKESVSVRKYKWAGRQLIQNLVKGGQEILVQVTREPIGTKGARITSHISLPGRFLVFTPTWDKIGVSKKIESFEERKRLRQIIRTNRPPQGGVIVRTAAEGVSSEHLIRDIQFLTRLWEEILRKKDRLAAPTLIQAEFPISLRAIRDLYATGIDKMVVDDPEEYEKLKGLFHQFMPEMEPLLQLYTGLDPIFDKYGIEAEIHRALGKKIWLKSGGYLIIDQTEALITIDVNTGRFTGKKNLEETIIKNNLEAVEEIVYQLKIRNLGGMIILDFIDMEKRENREKVYQALRDALKKDRAKTTITKISELGLIEMTRKRTRESLVRVLCGGCPYCASRGYVKSPETVTYDIFRELKREINGSSSKKLLLSLHPSVMKLLQGSEKKNLDLFEKKIKKRIELESRPDYHLEQFDWKES